MRQEAPKQSRELAGLSGSFSSNQQGKPWKKEMSSGIVDHINLAGIKSRLYCTQRQIQLEDTRLPFPCIHLSNFDHTTLEGFGFAAEKRHGAKQVNARRRLRGSGTWRSVRPARIV